MPGEAQRQYALRLGFEEGEIRTGFYSADTQKFDGFYGQLSAGKQNALPKRFLYLGRYVEHKGIFDLWSAFAKYRQARWRLGAVVRRHRRSIRPKSGRGGHSSFWLCPAFGDAADTAGVRGLYSAQSF